MRRGAVSLGAAVLVTNPIRSAGQTPPRRLGIGMHSYGTHWQEGARGTPGSGFRGPMDFLRHARALGAGGIQVAIGHQPEDALRELRSATAETGLYLEAQAALPADEADVARFEREVRCARAAGADVMRTALLSGRRYETFRTLAAFREFEQRCARSLALAEPILRRHRLRLALENHKDWLVPELLGWMRRFSSEWLGICVDTGNSLALLEDPLEVVEAYAPFAASTHLKDMAMGHCDDGFLLAEVPLGRGCLDLRRIVATVERANPRIRWNIEMITRDPLRVPCLTSGYWGALPGLRASQLAAALERAARQARPESLPRVAGLDMAARLQLEDQNVRLCLAYGREVLGR
ncbi:MAG TPA: TIM barrel protein [Methylomirabilota bacterium]|nr:TIM barrel protein [Methylomirabilota bacterium]